jgi:hypothetical protein
MGEQFLIIPLFARYQKYEHGGQLNVKIHILFYRNNSWTVALVRKMKFGTVNAHGQTNKFYLNHYYL